MKNPSLEWKEAQSASERNRPFDGHGQAAEFEANVGGLGGLSLLLLRRLELFNGF